MKTFRGILLLLLLFSMVSIPSFAQEKGDKEVIISGMGLTFVGMGRSFHLLCTSNFSYGYFLTDSHEIGGSFIGPLAFVISSDDFSGGLYLGGQFFYRYNHKRENTKLHPYVEGSYYIISLMAGDISEPSYGQGSIGFKYYLKPTYALDVKGGVGFHLTAPENNIFVTTSFGIAFFF